MTTRRLFVLSSLILGIIPIGLLSIFVGSRLIHPDEVFAALHSFDPSQDTHLIVRELRIPRTIIALVTGASLGLAGVLMQTLTRNTLAEPGTLGVNAGAAAGVVIGLSFYDSSPGISTYVWFAFAGAAVAASLVHRLGRAQDATTNPVRLILAGAGISVVLGSLTNILILSGPSQVFDAMRAWATGSLDGRGWDYVPVAVITCGVGLVLCAYLAPQLNAVALGADVARSIGVSVGRTWLLTNIGIIVLAGGATAAIGPIAFVGLAAPHIARWITGTDHRWLLPYSAVIAAYVLVFADIVGRVVVYPTEVGAGIMTALLGAPLFIWVVRRGKVQAL
ncbi:MAG: iron ABC transporter permease [Corynebacterium sp.]|nr:iron ABC transporter permease [Corynebacterium sp.]